MTAVLPDAGAASAGALPRPPPLDLRRHALFLDLDGTLTPLRPRPEDVGPELALSDLLQQLVRGTEGAVAVVSGRAMADVEQITGGTVPALAGVHGLERRSADGRRHSAEPSPALVRAAEALRSFAGRVPGLLVEDKGLAVTLHWRLAPDQQQEARALAADLAAGSDLVLQHGDHVAELKTPGADKGSAVRAFMAEPPFAGRIPVFVGDDLTDEHGFAAATELGGFGVLAGTGRATAAAFGLADAFAVRAWLGVVA